jgi:hypothetical protein
MAAPLRTAIVYDFDGTLAPRNLPEHTFLPALGIDDPDTFWHDVKTEAQAHDGCEILAYMHRMLEVAKARGVAVTRGLLQEHGRSVPLFAGVEAWFDEIDAYGREKQLAIEHYVISSGILEFIEGCRIYPRFRKVFATRRAGRSGRRARSTTPTRRSSCSGSTRASTTSGTTRRSTPGSRSGSGRSRSSGWCFWATATPTFPP